MSMPMNEEIQNIDDDENIEQEILPIALEEKLKNLPTKPGIYQYFNDEGKIIYIGKAKNLRSRVRSYFQSNRPRDAKTKALVVKIHDLEIIVVDSEAEALILENNLIKKHRPKYNILLKDDKTYPFIRITNEEYPKIFATRKVIRDGSKYFGPYTDVRYLKYILKTIRSIFLIRSCNLKLSDELIDKKKFKICLDFHIKKCFGPCEAHISKAEYNDNIAQATKIIMGKTGDLQKALEEMMTNAAENLHFEKAGEIRDKLLKLNEFTSKQKVASPDLIDRDVFGYSKIDKLACVVALSIREGKLIAKRHYLVGKADHSSDEDILETSIEKFYLDNDFVPQEICLPFELENISFVKDWLKTQRGKSIEINIPKIGEKKKLVDMAITNAEFLVRERQIEITKKDSTIPRAILSLQRDLRLSKPPLRIECFDNSHLQGSDLVSSMVVFVNGKAKKSDYRRFKNKTVERNDDFAAMREAVLRRYTGVLENKEAPPDLIIIDGGKGQLSAAMESLTLLNLNGKLNIIGLAKRLEEVFTPHSKEPILLPKTSSALKILQQARDEAHRFAITYHRLLRDKRTFTTALLNIEGIGKTTADKLLKEVGSLEDVKNSSVETLRNIVGEKLAIRIKEYFAKESEEESSE